MFKFGILDWQHTEKLFETFHETESWSVYRDKQNNSNTM